MRSVLAALLVLVALTALGTAPNGARAAGIEVGVAVADITPPPGYRMSGYFHERLATGVHDPLKAKALVLVEGDRQAALVFCDIIGLSPDVSASARRLAEEKTGIPASNIMIAATHSHTGPLYFGALRKHFHDLAIAEHGNDPNEKVDYPGRLVEKLVEAIAAARTAAGPVKIQAGVGRQLGLSFNRRFHMKDGSVRTNPGSLNPNIVRAAGPIDPEVGIVLFRGLADDRPVASLTSFALHLDTVGGTLYSADYPYYLSESLCKELGDGFVSLFGNGTCGDINHFDVTSRDRLRTQHIGETLAATVAAELPRLKAVERPALAVRSRIVRAPMKKYTAEQVAAAKLAMGNISGTGTSSISRVEAYNIMAIQLIEGDTLPIEVQVFRLGKNVAIVALPGEAFVELGLAIKKASPFAVTPVIELANDAPGYIPTRKGFAEGSYETVNSRIQPGGGEMAVEAAIELLGELHADLR